MKTSFQNHSRDQKKIACSKSKEEKVASLPMMEHLVTLVKYAIEAAKLPSGNFYQFVVVMIILIAIIMIMRSTHLHFQFWW